MPIGISITCIRGWAVINFSYLEGERLYEVGQLIQGWVLNQINMVIPQVFSSMFQAKQLTGVSCKLQLSSYLLNFNNFLNFFLVYSNTGDMCEKETMKRKGEKEKNERRSRALSCLKGFKIFACL